MELKQGKVKGFSKPFGFIDGLKFHVNQVSGGIENGKDAYYDLDINGQINMVYGINANFPDCYLNKEEVIEEKVITPKPKIKKKSKIKKEKQYGTLGRRTTIGR